MDVGSPSYLAGTGGQGSQPNGIYTFRSLDHDSIRLLQLSPSISPSAELHCDLLHSRLSGELEYEALSYTWGAPVFPEKLHLPNGYLNITENLASALRRLRLVDRPRTIWADAVCINQNDAVEKGCQVGRMAEIYRSAQTVLVWLGEPPSELKLDLEAVLELSRQAEKIGLSEVQGAHRQTLLEYLRGNKSGVLGLTHYVTIANAANFRSLYSHPWFTRMWTVQEAVLARRLTICHGEDTLEWADFEKVMMLLKAVNDSINLPFPDMKAFTHNAWNLIEVNKTCRLSLAGADSNSPSPFRQFHTFAHEFRRRDCKDDRDRIYALLGLLPENGPVLIEPSYEKTVAEVYIEAARNQLKHGQITVLYEAGLCRRCVSNRPDSMRGGVGLQETSLSLPSWVPDYRKSRTVIGWTARFGADFRTNRASPGSIALTDNSRRIIVEGMLIDCINFTKPALFLYIQGNTESHVTTFKRMREFCRDLKTTYDSRATNQNYPTGEDRTSAFAHALVGGGNDAAYKKNFGFPHPTDPLSLWQLYERQCIDEEGELYRKMQEQVDAGDTGGSHRGVSYEFYRDTSPDAGRAWTYHHHLVSIFKHHWFFMTTDGYVGLAPFLTGVSRNSDSVAFLDGAMVPFILRTVGEDRSDWAVIGPCYIHGVMDADAAAQNSEFCRGPIALV